MIPLGRVLLVWLGLLAGPGCQQSGAHRSAQELASLGQAIQRVREAGNETKQAPLRELRSLACDHYCDLQKLCVDAYDAHLSALDVVTQARAAAARDPEVASRLLSEARARLARAHEMTTACAAREGEAGRAREGH